MHINLRNQICVYSGLLTPHSGLLTPLPEATKLCNFFSLKLLSHGYCFLCTVFAYSHKTLSFILNSNRNEDKSH